MDLLQISREAKNMSPSSSSAKPAAVQHALPYTAASFEFRSSPRDPSGDQLHQAGSARLHLRCPDPWQHAALHARRRRGLASVPRLAESYSSAAADRRVDATRAQRALVLGVYLAQASSWCAANLVHAYRRAPASGSLRKHLATSSTSTSCFTASPKPRCSTSTATRWTSTAHTCGADKSTRRPIGRGSLWRISARNTVATQFTLRVQLRNVPKRCD
jgi:hypothetical protein